MKTIFRFMVISALLTTGLSASFAATENPSTGSSGYMVLPIHFSGQFTATTLDRVNFNMPFPATIINCQLTARASGGTSPTLTITVQQGATTLCTGAVTAGVVSEPAISSTTIPDEASITVDFTIGGTSPTWNDVTVLLTLKRQ